MRMLRDLGPTGRFPYLSRLGFDPEDLGRLEVADGLIGEGGVYVDAATGEARVLTAGARVPDGVWVAQHDIDAMKPSLGEDLPGRHGAGQGWGEQGAQVGGDRSIPEEDAGGTVRDTPNRDGAEA